jgi:hypothetical protein
MDYFKSLVRPSDSQPVSQYWKAKKQKYYLAMIIKDQMTLTSWLAIGACFNTLLFLAIGRIALFLPFLLIVFRVGDAILQTYGFKKNPLMDGAILDKYSAQMPNDDGTFGPKPANQQIVVFLIGARCNQSVFYLHVTKHSTNSTKPNGSLSPRLQTTRRLLHQNGQGR